MTREEAYYLKILLLSSFRADYEEELNGYLEAEEPISDIVLTLAFLGSDIEKVIYELGCYCIKYCRRFTKVGRRFLLRGI